MNKSLALIPVMFAIFALMVSPAIMSAYAGTENNGRDKGTKNAYGCEKGGKASDEGHNPNCGNLFESVCDLNSDGSIPNSELSAARAMTASVAAEIIHIAESALYPESNPDHNSQINTVEELTELNNQLSLRSYPTC